MSDLAFSSFTLIGVDALKFLQGQVTVNVEALAENVSQYTAICDLKGRIHFGLWLKKLNPEHFEIVTTQDQAEEFAKHIKKFGAFSTTETDVNAWQLQAIDAGQAWISAATEHLFQPQELRLHQRNGVHYDKGCYLGQEIIARLWFKAKPKSWLHLVLGGGHVPAPATLLNDNTQIVNSVELDDTYKALVVAKPAALAELSLDILNLPEGLNGDVARPQ